MRSEGYITTSDNGKVFYTEQGKGQPIVFIHGWSSYGEHSFGHLADALSDDARCIYYDLRGHGKSYSYKASSIG